MYVSFAGTHAPGRGDAFKEVTWGAVLIFERQAVELKDNAKRSENWWMFLFSRINWGCFYHRGCMMQTPTIQAAD